MPEKKPQDMKSLHTIGLQPKEMTSKIEVILAMDVAGRKGNDIASTLGLTASRVSIIRNSPMYIAQLEAEKNRVRDMFRDKHTDNLTSGDPVEQALKDAALEAAQCKIDLMRDGKSEFVRLAASGDVLDRAGYKAASEKHVTSIEVTEKMADRFERALKFKVTTTEST